MHTICGTILNTLPILTHLIISITLWCQHYIIFVLQITKLRLRGFDCPKLHDCTWFMCFSHLGIMVSLALFLTMMFYWKGVICTLKTWDNLTPGSLSCLKILITIDNILLAASIIRKDKLWMWKYLKKELRLQKPNQDTPAHLLKWPKAKTMITPNVGKDMERQELSFTVGENARWYSHFGWELSSFLQNKHSLNLMVQLSHSLVFTQVSWKFISTQKSAHRCLNKLNS